ncbi:uncharacterized protein LOC116944690 isoform X3 [Petromyzon marinus]|uniref:uncharacterized protein LOC116944690 isoform X3 n=1 Tax=Petromyzon marinus TaxID=7757 RepID=UPI003F7259E7
MGDASHVTCDYQLGGARRGAEELPEPRVSMPTLSSSAPPSRASVPLSYITAWSDGGGGPEEPPERLAWRQQMERRLRVLEELLETERDFLCDLRVFRKRVFVPLQQLGCASALNGDLDSVIALSSRLFSELRHLVITNDTPSQIVGSVFLGVRDEVEGVYKSYCAHHEQGLAEMEMWSHDPHSCDCLQASITALREIYTHVGKRRLVDVPSFLILPVQRVTRYPLLLTELARHTPLSHPDCEPLARAVASLREANMAINNAQRLVVRRVPPPPAPLSVLAERLFRRGVSSLAKTTAQIRQLAGLTSRDDDGGEDLAKRFRVLHIDVKTSAATAATSPTAITATTSTVINNDNSNNNNNHTRQEEAEVAVAAVSVSGERLVASQPEGEADGRHGNRAVCRVPLRRHSDAEGGAAPRSPGRRHEERSHTDGEMDDDDGGSNTCRTRAGLGLAKCAGDAKRRARPRPPGPKQEPKSKQEEELNPKQELKQEQKLKPKQEGKPTTERRLKPQKNRAETPGAEADERVARWRLTGLEEPTDSDRTDSVRTGSDSGFDSLSRSRNPPRPPARGPHPPHPPLPLPPPASPAPEASSGRAPRRARTDGDHRGSPPRGPPRFSDDGRYAPPPLRRPKSSHDLLGSGYDYNDDDYGRPRSDCPTLHRDRRPRCPPLHDDPAGPPHRAPDYGTLQPLHHTASAPVFVHHTTDRVLGRQRRHRSPRGLDVVDCGIRLPPPAVHQRPPPGAHHRSPPIVHHRSPPSGVHPDRGRQPPYRDSTVERGRRGDGYDGDGYHGKGCRRGCYSENEYHRDGYHREGRRGDGYRGDGIYGDGYRSHGNYEDGYSGLGTYGDGYYGDRTFGDGCCGDRTDGDSYRGAGYHGDRGAGRRRDGCRGDGRRGDGYPGDGRRGNGYPGDGCGSPSSADGAPNSRQRREHEKQVTGGADGRELVVSEYFYQAVFSFSALLPNQLSVRARERVRVLCFHDEAGNSAWWLAEGPAGQGYLPAAYLRASHYT